MRRAQSKRRCRFWKGRHERVKVILKTFMDYSGSGIYPFLFLAALIYLLVTEKDKKIRIVLLESSAVILVLFFCPLFQMVMEKVDGADTYYRILWLLPMTVVTAYAGVKLIGKHTRVGLAVLAGVCILCGDYVYDNVNVSQARNRYHLPEEVVAICDLIMPAEGEERVWAVFPSELLHFVRQYSSRIQMPYGRDMLLTHLYYEAHPMYPVMEAETVDLKQLAQLAQECGVQYIILNKAKPTEGEPKKCGLEKIGEIGGYDIFRNPSVPLSSAKG